MWDRCGTATWGREGRRERGKAPHSSTRTASHTDKGRAISCCHLRDNHSREPGAMSYRQDGVKQAWLLAPSGCYLHDVVGAKVLHSHSEAADGPNELISCHFPDDIISCFCGCQNQCRMIPLCITNLGTVQRTEQNFTIRLHGQLYQLTVSPHP